MLLYSSIRVRGDFKIIIPIMMTSDSIESLSECGIIILFHLSVYLLPLSELMVLSDVSRTLLNLKLSSSAKNW